MLKKDFWYDLPKELIAQEPADPRDSARLLCLGRKSGQIEHHIFHDLPDFLQPGDLLVVNNSKVLPARLVGTKVPTGAVCEVLLLHQVKGDTWECLAKPGKRLQPGTVVSFGDGTLTATIDSTMEDGNKYVTFHYDHFLYGFGHGSFHSPLAANGFLVGLSGRAGRSGNHFQIKPGMVFHQSYKTLANHTGSTYNTNFVLFHFPTDPFFINTALQPKNAG